MRIIIPGGSGLIGRPLSTKLAASGHEVIILSRSPKRIENLPENVRAEKWDAKTVEGDWADLVDGAGAIINLAGAGIGDKRWTAERKRLIMTSRLETTQALVEAVSKAEKKPEVWIQGSAIGYYGDQGDKEMIETSSPGADFVADVVKKWESAVTPAADMVRLVIIRTGNVMTTKGGVLPKLMLQVNLLAGGPLGSGKQWFSWVHIDDWVAAVVHLLNHQDKSGIYNIAAPEALQNRTFVKTLGKVLGRPTLAPPVPSFALKMVLGEMAHLVTEGVRVNSQKLIDSGFEFEYPRALRALKDVVYSEK